MRVVVGLGGNLGAPRDAFEQALQRLAAAGHVQARSRLYRSRAVGPPQPDYLNAAALLDTFCDLRSLLALCHELETAAGRDRKREPRWGPRPLDLDLLIADGVVCCGPRLTLPHPRLLERAFALVPAAAVAPGWVHTGARTTLAVLAARVLAVHPADVVPVDTG